MAVVGGLCLSQVLTLYITPVVYLYLDKVDRLVTRRLNPPAVPMPQEYAQPAVAAE